MKNKEEGLEFALEYIKTFSDTAREPFLILSPELKIIGANKGFYEFFKVSKKETENRYTYDIGNGQWDIKELKELLENILPKKRVFNDYEISHEFPSIGLKIIALNARQLDHSELILLAIEDITLKKTIETKLADYTKALEEGIASKTEALNARIQELQELNDLMVNREMKMIELKKEISDLKKKKSA